MSDIEFGLLIWVIACFAAFWWLACDIARSLSELFDKPKADDGA